MIHDVDSTLAELLFDELAKTESALKSKEQIHFNPAGTAAGTAKEPALNLYLHELKENLSLRDDTIRVTRDENYRPTAKRRSAIRLDLSYLLTANAGDDASVEHRLLADVLAVLFRNQMVDDKRLPEALKIDGQPFMISVAQPEHRVTEESAVFVGTAGGRLRPKLTLVVTASFNPFETEEVKLVREAILKLFQGPDPQNPGPEMGRREIHVSIAGRVTGPVYGKTELVGRQGVRVTIPELGFSAITDDRGIFHFSDLANRKYKLRFEDRGFETQEIEAAAMPRGRTRDLEPMLVRLVPVGQLDGHAVAEPAEKATAAAKRKG